MKFNTKQMQIEVDPDPLMPGSFQVTKGCKFVKEGWLLRMDELKTDFIPADCEALDLVDPDRNERLSK